MLQFSPDEAVNAASIELHKAVAAKSVTKMEHAIAFGADVNFVNPASCNHVCSLLQAVYINFVAGVQVLLDHNANVNLANPNGWTALVQAAYSGRVECTELLLEAGADLNQSGQDSDGSFKTPLEFAVKMCNHDVAKLIESKVAECSEVTAASKALYTALTACSGEVSTEAQQL